MRSTRCAKGGDVEITYNLADGKTLSSHVTAHAPDGFSKRKPRLEISNHGLFINPVPPVGLEPTLYRF